MERHCLDTGTSRTKRAGYLAAVVLGFSSTVHPDLATAANAKRHDMVRIERRVVTRVAPPGPVVLRGSTPANSNSNQAAPAVTQGYGASSAPAGALPLGAGLDTSLDRSGLSPPRGFLYLGQ